MQFFIKSECKVGDIVKISGPDMRHIKKSLRKNRGDKLQLVDSAGRKYEGNILDFHSRFVVCSIIKILNSDMQRKTFGRLILAQALINNKNMRFVIQKAAEMGTDVIAPIISARSNIRPSGADKISHLERWERVVYEAWKQSESSVCTEILDIVHIDDFIRTPSCDSMVIYLAERDFAQGNLRVPNVSAEEDTYLIVGPEGGFTEEEVALFRERGYFGLSLGASVLKSETASICALAVVGYERRLTGLSGCLK